MKKSKKIINYGIIILFIMLPIIDCLRTTTVKDIEILGFSIIELPYILIIGISTIITVVNIRKKKKELFYLFIYTTILILYIIFHDINILKFNSDIYLNSNINIITETYYILRVYYMPILLLFVLIENRDIFNLDFYKKMAKTLILMISLSIVLLNISKTSFGTYVAENKFISYNIFDFYKSSESSKLLSTRGLFDSGNEISAILLILFPINIYLLYEENKKFNVFLYVIQFIAMIILGTRVSALGAILVAIVAILINIFSKIVKHDKINYRIIIFGFLSTGYFFISPVGTYLLNYNVPNYNFQDEYSEYLKNINNSDEIKEYINEHLYDFRIDETFIRMYPIENDISFWKDIALGDLNINNDSRKMKTKIIKRIKERNNNSYDSLLGMGYTINFIDLERDYVYQYYLFGLLGIILIIPQLLVFFKSCIMVLKNLKKISLIKTLILFMSSTLGFVVAFYSGHVFGWISPSYVLVFSLAILICFLDINNKNLCNKR